VNIGPDRLAEMAMIRHIPGPLGVRGGNSDTRPIKEKLARAPSQPLVVGMEKTYVWIVAQAKQAVISVILQFAVI
jgi:GDP-D-mannose 3',5'-epimerase